MPFASIYSYVTAKGFGGPGNKQHNTSARRGKSYRRALLYRKRGRIGCQLLSLPSTHALQKGGQAARLSRVLPPVGASLRDLVGQRMVEIAESAKPVLSTFAGMFKEEQKTMFEHMLVPLDGSPLAECVLPHTVALAQAFGSRVTLLQVLERRPTYHRARSVDPLGWNLRKAEAEAYLEGWAARLQKLGFETESRLLEGQAAEQIIEFAHGHEVELIVLSSHGRSGLSGWNISSVVQKIILRAYLPTMIVRAYQPYTSDLRSLHYRRLLVPLDGSQRAECVLPLVTSLARFHGSRLLLAHLVCRPEIPRRVPLTQEEIELVNELTERNRLFASSYLEKIRSQLPVDVETRLLVSDDIAATLHDLVEEEDVAVVVLGAHGYSGRAKWPYGSVALSFIVYGTTPLLIVQDLGQEEVERSRAETAATEHKGH